jgi:hypothetical protein
MTATVSNSYDFVLDVDEIIEEALDDIGGDFSNGQEQKKARRTLNLLLIELTNKSVPIFTIENISTPVTTSDSYDLGNSINDVLECNLKTIASGIETPLSRYKEREYHRIPNKTTTNRPSNYFVDRQYATTVIKLWPVPPASSVYTLETLVARRIQDVTASFQRLAVPYRFYPLIIQGLRFKLALKKDDMDPTRLSALRAEYNEIMVDTWSNDKERVDFYFYPHTSEV